MLSDSSIIARKGVIIIMTCVLALFILYLPSHFMQVIALPFLNFMLCNIQWNFVNMNSNGTTKCVHTRGNFTLAVLVL